MRAKKKAITARCGAINGIGLTNGFVVDMGGGSVQVVEVQDKTPGRAASVQLGALHVAETYLGFDAAKPGAVRKLTQRVRDMLAEQFDWFKVRDGAELVAIGGTIRNLASMAQSEDGYPLDSVDHYVLAGSDVQELGDRLWHLTAEERAKLGGLHPDRADIIHAGALVYSLLLEHSGFDAITVSRQGLREGLFYEEFLAGQGRPVIADLRAFSALNLARNFGQDTAHTHHVAFLALRLFDDLAEHARAGSRPAVSCCGRPPCCTTSASKSATATITSTPVTSSRTACCPATPPERRCSLR